MDGLWQAAALPLQVLKQLNNMRGTKESDCVFECVHVQVCLFKFGQREALTNPCPLVPMVTECIITPARILRAHACAHTYITMPACITPNQWPRNLL